MMKTKKTLPCLQASLVVCSLIVSGCSSTPRIQPELSDYEGKKIALVEVKGKRTAKRVAEVALINQLSKRGTFILLNKKDLEKVRSAYHQDPRKWQEIAQRAGAEYALRILVKEFSAEDRQGYSKEKVYDSQLAAERGEDAGTTERVFKVKSLTGKVNYLVEFTDLKSGEVRKAHAQAKKVVTQDERKGGIHLPPRLRFLEDLSNEAFETFFEEFE